MTTLCIGFEAGGGRVPILKDPGTRITRPSPVSREFFAYWGEFSDSSMRWSFSRRVVRLMPNSFAPLT